MVEALRYAFDRGEFIRTVTAGLATVSHQPFPAGNAAFDASVEKLWGYDPGKARALLREAGYPPGKLAIEIAVNPVMNDGLPELVQAQLARVGVKSTLRIVPPGSSTWQSEVYIAKRPALALDGTIGRESPCRTCWRLMAPKGS